MPQLFSRSANSLARRLLLAGCAAVLLGPLALLAFARGPAATGQYRRFAQPVRFSHPLHANGLAIDCRYCHSGAERSALAGLPPTESCLPCHHSGLLNTAPFDAVRESMEHGTPIRWRRVTRVPDFVFFDHAIHTVNGFGCETCHGRVDLMVVPYQAAPLTMSWCLECHRDPARYIRPRDAVTVMGWTPPSDRHGVGAALVDAYGVRSITTCTACHR